MGVNYNAPESVIWNGLVFHIDPPNKNHCIAESDRVVPLTTGDVKEMTGNAGYGPGNNIGISDTYSSSNIFQPEWSILSSTNRKLGDDLGYIRFHSNGAGSSQLSYYYGIMNLGTPITGVTQFGETDCYTVDLWWKQDTTGTTYVYQGGHLLGHRDVITSYVDYNSRKYVYGSYNIDIYGVAASYYNFQWRAGQQDYDNSDKKYYSASSGTMFSFNTWYHHCCVFDLGNSLGGGSKIYTYRDGTSVSSASATTEGSASWYTNTFGGGNIYIGASNRQGTGSNANSLRTNGADGGMGPLKIYNRALTSTEVKQNYTAMKGRYK